MAAGGHHEIFDRPSISQKRLQISGQEFTHICKFSLWTYFRFQITWFPLPVWPKIHFPRENMAWILHRSEQGVNEVELFGFNVENYVEKLKKMIGASDIERQILHRKQEAQPLLTVGDRCRWSMSSQSCFDQRYSAGTLIFRRKCDWWCHFRWARLVTTINRDIFPIRQFSFDVVESRHGTTNLRTL